MKTLLLNLMLMASVEAEAGSIENYDLLLKELAPMEIPATDVVGERRQIVHIFDLEGNMVKEIDKDDFIENTMESSDYETLAQSEYIFSYIGDIYFIKN